MRVGEAFAIGLSAGVLSCCGRSGALCGALPPLTSCMLKSTIWPSVRGYCVDVVSRTCAAGFAPSGTKSASGLVGGLLASVSSGMWRELYTLLGMRAERIGVAPLGTCACTFAGVSPSMCARGRLNALVSGVAAGTCDRRFRMLPRSSMGGACGAA